MQSKMVLILILTLILKDYAEKIIQLKIKVGWWTSKRKYL